MNSTQARAAIKNGKRHAQQTLAAREVGLKERERAIRAKPAKLSVSPPLKKSLLLAAGTASSEVLLAEGDSWFDYPLHDVLKDLEDFHGYEIESVAHKGDAVEQMAYSAGQLDDLTRLLEKLIRNGRPPKAILLSGGGNDVAGDEFAMMLNHSLSAARGLNASVLQGVISERIKLAYMFVIAALTAVCQAKLGRKIPIILHGYGYAVPDGRGFLGGWPFPGPWLEPGFRAKGYTDFDECKNIVKQMIDALNEMLATLTRVAEFDHLHYVNLRPSLSNGSDYKQWWANELHPTKKGFQVVADKIASVVAGISA